MNYLSFAAAALLPLAMISCVSVSSQYEPAQSAVLLLAQDSTLAAMLNRKANSDETQVSLMKKYVEDGISRVQSVNHSSDCQDFLQALVDPSYSQDGGLAFEEKFPVWNAILMMGTQQALAGMSMIQKNKSGKTKEASALRARKVFAIQENWLQDAQMQDFLRVIVKANLKYSPLVWNMTWVSNPPPPQLLKAELEKKEADNSAYFAELRSAATRLPASMRTPTEAVLDILQKGEGISGYGQLSDEQLAAFFYLQTTPMIARILEVYEEEKGSEDR